MDELSRLYPLTLIHPIRNPRSQAFTLIEMLTVVAIISILATLAFVNSSSTLQATGLTQGGRLVLDTLNYARENAVTQSVLTVAVVRSSGADQWRRVAVFSIPAIGTGWTQASKWQTLPKGAIIDSTYNPAGPSEPTWTTIPNTVQESLTGLAAPVPPIQDSGVPLAYRTDYYAVGFLPDGSLDNPNNIVLRIVRGRSINGVITMETDANGQPLDWLKLIIVQISGRTKQIRKGQ